jgi:hypothetical protein
MMGAVAFWAIAEGVIEGLEEWMRWRATHALYVDRLVSGGHVWRVK